MEVKGNLLIVNGKLLVDGVEVALVTDIQSGFYGITAKQSDDAQSYSGLNTLSFATSDFYLTQNAGNTDEAQINLRPTAATPPTAPGGSANEIQYNAAGSFGGATNFEFDAGEGQVLHPDGTVAKPGLTFKADDTLGLYRDDDVLGVAADGKDAARFTRDKLVVAGGFYSVAFGEPSYKVSQSFAAAVEWQLTHNLGTKRITWSAYDDGDRAIIPQTVDVSNPNVAYFYFGGAVAGVAVVTG